MTMHSWHERDLTPHEAVCDWCGTLKRDCVSHADWEEGGIEPQYEVCAECIRTEAEWAEDWDDTYPPPNLLP